MLHLATQATTLLSRANSVHTAVFTSQPGMTSTVLAGDYGLNDSSSKSKTSSGGRTTLQSSGSRSTSNGSSSELSSSTSSILKGDAQSSKNGEKDAKPTELRRSGTLSLLDNTMLPIKNQITLRKAGLVIRMLLLLRLATLCLQPANTLSTTFPYLPLDYVSSRPLNSNIAFTELPFVVHFTQSPILSLSTWTSFAYNMGIHIICSVLLIFYDFFMLHRLMLSSETLIVVLLALLIHPLTSWMDARIHKEFYDPKDHKNIHQLPEWLSNWGKKGFKYLRQLLLIASVWPGSHALSREANMVLILCTVWMSVFKRFLKKFVDSMHIRPALRPPNQSFPRGMYFGGFPSGHVSQCFVAMLIVYHVWGLSNLMGLALLAQTLITFVWVVSANRHYLSQVIAGLSLGAVYGFAAIAWLQRVHGPDTFRAGEGYGWSLFSW